MKYIHVTPELEGLIASANDKNIGLSDRLKSYRTLAKTLAQQTDQTDQDFPAQNSPPPHGETWREGAALYASCHLCGMGRLFLGLGCIALDCPLPNTHFVSWVSGAPNAARGDTLVFHVGDQWFSGEMGASDFSLENVRPTTYQEHIVDFSKEESRGDGS